MAEYSMRTWEAREKVVYAALSQAQEGLDTHPPGPHDDAQAEMVENQLEEVVLLYAHCIVRDRLAKQADGDPVLALQLRGKLSQDEFPNGWEFEFGSLIDQAIVMELALREIAKADPDSPVGQTALTALPMGEVGF